MSYSVSLPEAQQNGSPNTTVDFKLSFENRKLVCGSVRLSGKLSVKNGANKVALAEDIFIDPLCGVENFIQSVKTQFNGRSIENIDHYPRMVRMEGDVMNSQMDMMNSEKYTALKFPYHQLTSAILRGPDANRDSDFYATPSFCLNKAYVEGKPEAYLSFAQSGPVIISFTFTDLVKSFFGEDASNNMTYELTNLKIHYLTVVDDGTRDNVIFRTKYCVPQTIASSNASIDTNIPGMLVRSASMSFIKQSQASSYFYNSYATQELPNVKRVTFLFNDTNNNKVSFPLDTREEILSNYIQSFLDTGNNCLLPYRMEEPNYGSYGVGLDFSVPQDFTSQKFNVILESDASNANKYDAYIYFHGFVTV